MQKIAVIGLGQGGAVAGIKLAELGFSVDIFEKENKGEVSHTWYDDIRFDIFEFCSLPLPERECYTQKGKRLFIAPDEKNSLKVPSSKPMEEISISRRKLSEHLGKLCEEAGCSISYATKVDSLIIENEKVTGIIVNGESLSYDLVIDASGLFSPFRGQIPEKFGVQAMPGKNDVMRAWRGFYEWTPDTAAPEPDRNIYIKHLNSVGLSWCNLNDRDEVDVFVGRIGGLTEEEKDIAVEKLYNNHDFFSKNVIRKGEWGNISLRCPLAGMVADGYVAIGDSAFMTMPMMGSGIEASMKAAIWLTELIKEKNITDFSAKNLWQYQVKYYNEMGAGYTFVDIVKRWVLNIDVNLLNWLFGCGAVTNEDMGLVSTDPDNPYKLTVGKILKKVAIVLKKPAIISQTGKWMLRGVKAKKTALAIPAEYDIDKVSKWQKKYNAILDGLN